MSSMIYFVPTSRDSRFSRALARLCEGALAFKLSSDRKSILFSQKASRAGAQVTSMHTLLAESTELPQRGALATALNSALSNSEKKLYMKLRSEISQSQQKRIILIGKLTTLKKIASFYVDSDNESITRIPSWCAFFSIDSSKKKRTIMVTD